MIRWALIAVGVVVLYLYYTSRTAVATRAPYAQQPTSPWTALGQLFGAAIGSAAASKPKADTVYSRVGGTAPNKVTASTNWSPSGYMPSASPVYRSEYGTGGSYQTPELVGLRNEGTGGITYYSDVKDSDVMWPKDSVDD